MEPSILQRAERDGPHLFGVAIDALLAPVDGAAPGGISARASGVHQAIAQARRADDSSLPMGAWTHDLKRADWEAVRQMAGAALAGQGKDLQLAAWLLEAQIHLNGFAAVAAALHVLEQLCLRYWDTLHPQAEQDRFDHRANIFRWINEKLPPALRQVAIAVGPQQQVHQLADWERARRDDHLRRTGQAEPDGISTDDLAAAMAATPTDAYSAMELQLADAQGSLAALGGTIGALFGDQAPSLAGFGAVLEEARALVDTELYRRGVRRTAVAVAVAETAAPAGLAAVARDTVAATEAPIGDRAAAYARLNEAADYLLRLEPHSPVPYLIRRASEWGQLNAVELYQELFLRLGGQLNIFDMLGLEAQPLNTAHQ